jgi:hypothetical protein
MLLMNVNILVYAHREETPDHRAICPHPFDSIYANDL